MNSDPKTRDTRLLLSAGSKELRVIGESVKVALGANYYHAVEQDRLQEAVPSKLAEWKH